MKLERCRKCTVEIDELSRKCPHCGVAFPTGAGIGTAISNAIGSIVKVVVVLYLGFCIVASLVVYSNLRQEVTKHCVASQTRYSVATRTSVCSCIADKMASRVTVVDVFITTASRGVFDPMSSKIDVPKQDLQVCSPGLFDF